jgi:hypothetical protein
MWGLGRGEVGSEKTGSTWKAASHRTERKLVARSIPCPASRAKLAAWLNAAMQIVGEEGVEGIMFCYFILASGYFDIIILTSLFILL